MIVFKTLNFITCSGDGDKTEFSNCSSLGKFLAATWEFPPATRILSGTCIFSDAVGSLLFSTPFPILFIPFWLSPAPISWPPMAIRSGTYNNCRNVLIDPCWRLLLRSDPLLSKFYSYLHSLTDFCSKSGIMICCVHCVRIHSGIRLWNVKWRLRLCY